jgi:DNA-binding response OmpR family regulator
LPNYATLPNNRWGQRGHILVVEQNPTTSRATCDALRENRFQATVYQRGNSNGRNFSEYDLVVLEHRQTTKDTCLKILQRLRQVSPVPIVVLSDSPNSAARITALESGADDFLSRPYLNRELVARIKAILRRSRLASNRFQPEVLKIDREGKQVSVRGRPVDLTQREFEILSVLAAQPGRNFSRCEILDRVWGPEYAGDQRRVDLYISRIRSKMHTPGQEDLIRSIYGVGYRLEQ